MKQTLTFTPSVIPSTASRLDPDAFDRSLEAFNEKRYRDSFLALLDFIGKGLRTRYGNADATAFEIPHGSIVVRIRTDGGRLRIEAPFLELPGKGRIPLLRQAAVLNICGMDLPRIVLRGERLYFEYECPMTLVHPAKIYYVLRDICHTGDRYEGSYVQGERTGEGIYIHANGDKYVGGFMNGRQHGKGTFTWANGAVYDGDWADNERNGYGVYKWNNGDSYEGEWKHNQFDGQGKLKMADGTRYEGGFVNGLEEGKGIQTDKDGNTAEGVFKQGKKDGLFVEKDKNGKLIRQITYKMGRIAPNN